MQDLKNDGPNSWAGKCKIKSFCLRTIANNALHTKQLC